jgi:hypothetical protein
MKWRLGLSIHWEKVSLPENISIKKTPKQNECCCQLIKQKMSLSWCKSPLQSWKNQHFWNHHGSQFTLTILIPSLRLFGYDGTCACIFRVTYIPIVLRTQTHHITRWHPWCRRCAFTDHAIGYRPSWQQIRSTTYPWIPSGSSTVKGKEFSFLEQNSSYLPLAWPNIKGPGNKHDKFTLA